MLLSTSSSGPCCPRDHGELACHISDTPLWLTQVCSKGAKRTTIRYHSLTHPTDLSAPNGSNLGVITVSEPSAEAKRTSHRREMYHGAEPQADGSSVELPRPSVTRTLTGESVGYLGRRSTSPARSLWLRPRRRHVDEVALSSWAFLPRFPRPVVGGADLAGLAIQSAVDERRTLLLEIRVVVSQVLLQLLPKNPQRSPTRKSVWFSFGQACS